MCQASQRFPFWGTSTSLVWTRCKVSLSAFNLSQSSCFHRVLDIIIIFDEIQMAPVSKMFILHVPIFFISDPDTLREIFCNGNTFSDHPYIMTKLLRVKKGLITSACKLGVQLSLKVFFSTKLSKARRVPSLCLLQMKTGNRWGRRPIQRSVTVWLSPSSQFFSGTSSGSAVSWRRTWPKVTPSISTSTASRRR